MAARVRPPELQPDVCEQCGTRPGYTWWFGTRICIWCEEERIARPLPEHFRWRHRHRSAPQPLPPGGVVVTRGTSRLITPWQQRKEPA